MCIQPKSFFFLLFFFFVLQGPYQRYFVLSMAYYIRPLGPLKAPKKKKHQHEIIQLFSIILVLIQGLLKSNVKSVASIMFLKSQLKNKWQTKKDSV